METSSVTLIIATMVVVSSLLLLATIISCICCPQCPNYDKSSSLYKLEKPRVYRLEPGDSRDSGVTKTLSVSNGSSSPARMTELRHCERQLQPQHQLQHQLQHPALNGHWRQPGEEEGQTGERRRLRRSSDDGGALSHSYTLPHSVSHHSSISLLYCHYFTHILPLRLPYPRGAGLGGDCQPGQEVRDCREETPGAGAAPGLPHPAPGLLPGPAPGHARPPDRHHDAGGHPAGRQAVGQGGRD